MNDIKKRQDKLMELIKECDEVFRSIKQQYGDDVVGIPILWFGDMEAYFASELKIITFGINPSGSEFEANRFDNNGLWNDVFDARRYWKNYNSYFKEKEEEGEKVVHCYCSWFCGYTETLAKLNASLCEKRMMPNRAIHIDAFSPIGTKYTWGTL